MANLPCGAWGGTCLSPVHTGLLVWVVLGEATSPLQGSSFPQTCSRGALAPPWSRARWGLQTHVPNPCWSLSSEEGCCPGCGAMKSKSCGSGAQSPFHAETTLWCVDTDKGDRAEHHCRQPLPVAPPRGNSLLPIPAKLLSPPQQTPFPSPPRASAWEQPVGPMRVC